MAQQPDGRAVLILQTTDGPWFKIPLDDLTGYQMSEAEVGTARALIAEGDDTGGFRASLYDEYGPNARPEPRPSTTQLFNGVVAQILFWR